MLVSALVASLLFGQSSPDAASLLARLDLTSFRNSVGPRHLPSPATPDAAGFTEATFQEGWAARSRPGNPWTISLKVLSVEGDAVHVCFSDVALNGGSYFVRKALVLRPSGDLYIAEPSPRDDCGEMRSRSDGAPATR